tara:strand:+ start:400 stop:897 length:498 start_codon:yes stop_codon:yes gene_type:complete
MQWVFWVMEEQWKDIKGYEGLYKVSSYGNVKSLRYGKEKILKLGSDGFRKQVNLYLLGTQKHHKIHQLVAIAFLNHTPNGYKLVVDHIDNNPLNNRLDNLQVITQRENMSKDRDGGTSKYTGVCWNNHAKKWQARIHIDGKGKYLGIFHCELAASSAYQKALKQL